MPRWTPQEQECIATLKNRLKEQLEASPQFPEIVGERKMIRFLRGHNFDIDKVSNLMANFFKWRMDNKVDEIRTNIVERGMDHPLKFPKGELILSLIPQLILVPNAQDKLGCPICVEQYNFTPSEVFKYITIDDYILFVLYSLEFKSLIVEALSEQRELAFLNSLTKAERTELETNPNSKPYGVIVNICVVRDLNGVGFAHLSAQGQEIIKAVIAVASDNYPELMRKCFMINAPFLFNAAWYVIKGFLSPRTLAKVSLMGGNYMNELLQDIDKSQLPAMVGGDFTGFTTYEPYQFDRSYFVPDGWISVDVSTCIAEADASSAKDKTCSTNTTSIEPNNNIITNERGTATSNANVCAVDDIISTLIALSTNNCVLLRQFDLTNIEYADDGVIDNSGICYADYVPNAIRASMVGKSVPAIKQQTKAVASIGDMNSVISMRTSGF
uniref:CRAL-TRIO domain-containing protein n=1 Tax=Spumella elongata TaxID=89044 RepID=A0A7S3M0V6_9STRA|mmetsp:Transcript_17709/g.30807  ORF Transcript_17709/g.30807 Transcript_17709/m.30807 type:complete len:442 (+) Transcript_17709:181-1506(+)